MLSAPPPAPSSRWWEQEPYTPPWPIACAATKATADAEGAAHLAAAFVLTLAAWPGRPATACPNLEEALDLAVGRGRITVTMARSHLTEILHAPAAEPVQVLKPLAHTVRMLWARGIGVDLVALAREAAALLEEDPFTHPARRALARHVHGKFDGSLAPT
ncbi:hypothetical protein AB0M72_06810 [Nocardiopsis dassonvillei]